MQITVETTSKSLMKNKIIVTVFVAIQFFSLFACASVCPAHSDIPKSGEVKVYIEQYEHLSSQVEALGKRVIAGDQSFSVREEVLALIKQTYDLRHDSAKTDLERMKNGFPTNKTILLINQGCIVLDFQLSALDSYEATHDKSFILLYKNENNQIVAIKKLM